MWRKVLAAVSLALSLMAIVLLCGSEKMVGAIAVRVLDQAGLTLSYEHLEWKPFAGKLAVTKLLLTDQADSKPLARIGAATLIVIPSELLFGNNARAKLSARDVDIHLYLEETDDSPSDWKLSTWVGNWDLIPKNTVIENLNIYRRGDNPDAATRFAHIRIQASDAGSEQLLLQAEGTHDGADLLFKASLDSVKRREGELTGVGIHAEFSSQHFGTRWVAEGVLENSGDELKYTVQTEATAQDIQMLFRQLDVEFDLHGVTRMNGQVQGDLSGFSFAAETVSLDHSPFYTFRGAGRVNYAFNGSSDLDLALEGELADLGQLVQWLDLEVAELGSAKAKVKLQGSLDDLVLRDALITTRSEKGLNISLSGDLRVNSLDNNTLGNERGVDVLVTAPNIAALQAWTGELEWETGPLQLTGELREVADHLQILNIVLEAEGGAGSRLSARGKVGDAGSLLKGDLAGVSGIDLSANLSSLSSKPLTDLVGQDVRDLGPVAGNADISGSAEKLLVNNISATAGADGLQIEVENGVLELSLAPEFRLSDMQLPLKLRSDSTARLSEWMEWPVADMGKVRASMTLRQTEQGFGLPALQVDILHGETVVASHRGSVQELSPFNGIILDGTLRGLPTGGLIKTLAGDLGLELQDDLKVGRLFGQYQLTSSGEQFELNQISLENRGSQQLELQVDGRVQFAAKTVDMNLNLETKVSDRKLLETLSGLKLGTLSASAQITGSNQSIIVAGTTRLGSTELISRLLLSVRDKRLTDIKGSVTTGRLKLQDLGLDRFIEDEEPLPSQQEVVSNRDREFPLDALPELPIDLILAAAEIEGALFSAQDFSAHLKTGNGHYELKNILLTYTGGAARVSAALDMRPEIPEWNMNAMLSDFRIERLRDLGAPGNVTGNANTIMHLESRGRSPNQLLNKLDGQVAIALEDMTLKGAAYDRLVVDAIAWFYTGGAMEKQTRFNCVMGGFDIKNGIADSKFLFADSDYLVADGTARINLPAAELNLAITPKSKQRTFQIPGTIKIKGPWKDPKISTSALSTTADASAQLLLFAPTMAINIFDRSLRLFDRNKNDETPKIRKCPTQPLAAAPQ